MRKKSRKREHFYPPGYEFEKERKAARLLLGAGAAFCLRFFVRLYRVLGELYMYADGKLRLRQEALGGGYVVSFRWLIQGNWRFCLPFFLFLAAVPLAHYAYYFRGAKSVYLMRRLPGRWVMLKSCVSAPAFGIAAGAAILAAVHLLYYLIYLAVIPAECMP